MFPELAALLIMSGDFGRRAHLKTRHHPTHTALNDFYDELIELTDKLIEAYQGRHGLISIPECIAEPNGSDAQQALQKHLTIIEEVRYLAIPKEDTPLHGVIDEICVLYLRTLYKLANLN
jgi:hypothetical protein